MPEAAVCSCNIMLYMSMSVPGIYWAVCGKLFGDVGGRLAGNCRYKTEAILDLEYIHHRLAVSCSNETSQLAGNILIKHAVSLLLAPAKIID